MAQWMKRHLRRAQDRWASAIARSQPKRPAHHAFLLPVLRATGHDERRRLPDEEAAALEIISVVGSQSRARVSECVQAMMQRLSRARSWAVALKCLILIHRCFCEGGFMFRDQIALHREMGGGRNRLNMSGFEDAMSTFSWSASRWIRSYARFLERWIQTSRTAGFEHDPLRTLALPTPAFISEFLLLHDLVAEASSMALPDDALLLHHPLVSESLALVLATVGRAYQELRLRFEQIRPRIPTLTQVEAASLVHACSQLATESMLLTHLLEVCRDAAVELPPLPGGSDLRLDQILITDSELLKLKRDLDSASESRSLPQGPLSLGF